MGLDSATLQFDHKIVRRKRISVHPFSGSALFICLKNLIYAHELNELVIVAGFAF